jgi:hypothetical protein
MKGGSHGSNVHHCGETQTQRTKCPLPGGPNVEVVLRHFHQHNY